jgi:hypothetical protein
MRGGGLVFCLFSLMVLLIIFWGRIKSDISRRFSDNLLVALWLAFLVVWIRGDTFVDFVALFSNSEADS